MVQILATAKERRYQPAQSTAPCWLIGFFFFFMFSILKRKQTIIERNKKTDQNESCGWLLTMMQCYHWLVQAQ